MPSKMKTSDGGKFNDSIIWPLKVTASKRINWHFINRSFKIQIQQSDYVPPLTVQAKKIILPILARMKTFVENIS